MAGPTIIALARRGSGLSQRKLARRSGTSQPTLSTYEHGIKSPTLTVVERIVNTSGYDLSLTPRVEFTTHFGARGDPFIVPNRLWRLDPTDAFATVTLPRHLYWSGSSRAHRLRDHRDRARVYEIVLREGNETDLFAYVDGVLLVDLWGELVLPPRIRAAWAQLIGQFEDVSA